MTVAPIAASASRVAAGSTTARAAAGGSSASSGPGGSATTPPAAGGGSGRAFFARTSRRPAAGPRGGTGTPGGSGRSGTPGPSGAAGAPGSAGSSTSARSRAAQGQPNRVTPPTVPTLQSAEQSFDKTAAELGRLRLSPPTKVTARDGAGFLGGLLLYVLALNYLRYGKDGVKGWLGAKFVNRPMTLPDAGGDGGGDETGPGALEELLGGPLDLNRPKTPEQP